MRSLYGSLSRKVCLDVYLSLLVDFFSKSSLYLYLSLPRFPSARYHPSSFPFIPRLLFRYSFPLLIPSFTVFIPSFTCSSFLPSLPLHSFLPSTGTPANKAPPALDRFAPSIRWLAGQKSGRRAPHEHPPTSAPRADLTLHYLPHLATHCLNNPNTQLAPHHPTVLTPYHRVNFPPAQ